MNGKRRYNVKLKYRGEDFYITDVLRYSRPGNYEDGLEVYVLENGKRILPVHFQYGFVERPKNWFDFLLKMYLPLDLLEQEIKRENTIFKHIKKDPCWGGGYYPVPVNMEQT